MKFKKNGGFTLVELVVVIAILAILAGIAVPAYSGYVQKAEKAGDLQLLGAVNTAFASACMSESIVTDTVMSAAMNIDEDGHVNGITTVTVDTAARQRAAGNTTVVYTAGGTNDVTPISDAFMAFFAGNENAAFKVLKALYFNPLTHTFEELPDDGNIPVFIGGKLVEIDATAAKMLAESSFGKMGTTALVGQVDYIASLAIGLLSVSGEDHQDNALGRMVYSVEYMEKLAASMNMSVDELGALLAQQSDPDTFLGNSLVLQAAADAQSMNANDVAQLLKDGTLVSTLSSDFSAGKDGSIAQAAVAYGIYMSYANNKGLDTSKVTGLSTLQAALDDPEFKAYMDTDQAKQDVDAYMEALKLISDSANKSPETAQDILINGFDDPELMSILIQIMGQ